MTGEEIAERFASNLSRLRCQAGLSRAELGQRAGLPLSVISHLEGHKRLPRLDVFLKLCKGLGVTREQLLEGGDSVKDRKLIAERFGLNLLLARREAGLTQIELGQRVGLDPTAICHLERGRQLPRLDNFLALCEGLGVKPEQLLKGVSDES